MTREELQSLIAQGDLNRRDLSGLDMRGLDFGGAGLRGANLRGARISHDQLAPAGSLEGVVLPDRAPLRDSV